MTPHALLTITHTLLVQIVQLVRLPLHVVDSVALGLVTPAVLTPAYDYWVGE